MSNLWDSFSPTKQYSIKLGKSLTSKNVSYHSFRYNIKPPSIDHSKAGTLQCMPEDDTYTVEYASQQTDEIHQFTGEQKEGTKELILLFDEATNVFTLERLDSTFYLRREATTKSKRVLNRAPTQNNTSVKNNVAEQQVYFKNPIEELRNEIASNDSVEEFDFDSDNTNNEPEKETEEKQHTKEEQNESENNYSDDNLVEEFEEDLEEIDEDEDIGLEDEFEQELEKELENDDEKDDNKASYENDELSDNLVDEINDTLELDSSSEESDDNLSSSNKRSSDEELGSPKKTKTNMHDGPISLSAYAGNEDDEDEESTESSSSDDD